MAARKPNKNRWVDIQFCACGCGEKMNIYDERNRKRKYPPNHYVKICGRRNGRFKKGSIPWNKDDGYTIVCGYLANSVTKQYQHREIMEKYLGRKLERWETVHHIDGNKQNNNKENLELISNSDHQRRHGWIRKLHDSGFFYNRWSMKFERRSIFQPTQT
jgi:hypothetical protein